MPLIRIDIEEVLRQVPDTALIQLVYVSSATLRSRLDSSISADIESHASIYNQQHGITGILCYGNGQFLQCIEGSKTEILALYGKILADKRHNNFKIPLLQPIDRRMFDDWRMRLLFLERWLWSPATKTQAAQLAPYLPFAPHDWNAQRTEQFLRVVGSLENQPHMNTAGVTNDAFVNMCRRNAAPHQAFLAIQGILALLIGIALLFLWL